MQLTGSLRCLLTVAATVTPSPRRTATGGAVRPAGTDYNETFYLSATIEAVDIKRSGHLAAGKKSVSAHKP